MPKSIKRFLEWVGHFEAVQFIVESVRTLLWPAIVSAMTAYTGYLGGSPLMWIITAASLTFMALVVALYWGSEYISKRNPVGKVKYLRPAVGMDLVPTQENFIPFGASPPDRKIAAFQCGIEIVNTATFPLSVILEYADSEIGGIKPPRTEYPKPAVLIKPDVPIRFVDTKISMNELPCQPLTGKAIIRLKYGRPGKERHQLEFSEQLQVVMTKFGMIHGVSTTPVLNTI